MIFEIVQLLLIAGTFWYTKQVAACRTGGPTRKEVSDYVTMRIKEEHEEVLRKAADAAKKGARDEIDNRVGWMREDINRRVNVTLTSIVKRLVALEEEIK